MTIFTTSGGLVVPLGSSPHLMGGAHHFAALKSGCCEKQHSQMVLESVFPPCTDQEQPAWLSPRDLRLIVKIIPTGDTSRTVPPVRSCVWGQGYSTQQLICLYSQVFSLGSPHFQKQGLSTVDRHTDSHISACLHGDWAGAV